MHKTFLAVTVTTLALLLGLSALCFAQPGRRAPDADQLKSQMLIAFNRAELSL